MILEEIQSKIILTMIRNRKCLMPMEMMMTMMIMMMMMMMNDLIHKLPKRILWIEGGRTSKENGRRVERAQIKA